MSYFFFQAEDGIRDWSVTGVQTCALPISRIPSEALLLVDPRVDEKERLRGDPRFGREEPEWVATPEHDRTEPEAAAPLGFRQHLPFAGLAPTDREHATGERLRPVRLLEDLEPELPQGMIVRELVRELDGVAKVRIGLPEGSLHRKPLEREPRKDRHRDEHEQHEIREVREELDPRRHGDDEEDEPQDRETPGLQGLRPQRLA